MKEKNIMPKTSIVSILISICHENEYAFCENFRKNKCMMNIFFLEVCYFYVPYPASVTVLYFEIEIGFLFSYNAIHDFSIEIP